MKWYRKLYIGENASKCKYKVFGHVVSSRFTYDTFLITLSSNPDNLLDIISANYLMQPHFKKKINRDKIFIVGIAKGKDEAFAVVRDIIDDVYQNRGDFKIREYLKFGQKAYKMG
ncbi:MAG: hypothetical protein ACI4E1_13045 [Lachnospira sp.]